MKGLLALVSANRLRAPKLSARFLLDEDPEEASEIGTESQEIGDDATLWLYDAIGGWNGVDAANFAQKIAGLQAKTLHLRINSPGGDVFDAMAISAALDAFKGKVVAHVDGLAASSASFIMLRADEIEAAPGSFVMIHNPWGLAIGDAQNMRDQAALLDKVKGEIVADYVARTGLAADRLSALMDAETWMTADEALQNKFVDRVSARRGEKAAAHARTFDLSPYAHAPDALKAPPPAEPTTDTPALAEQLAMERERLEMRAQIFRRR